MNCISAQQLLKQSFEVVVAITTIIIIVVVVAADHSFSVDLLITSLWKASTQDQCIF